MAVLPAGHRLAAQKAIPAPGLRGGDLHLADAGGAGAESGDRELRGEIRRCVETAIRRRKHVGGHFAGDVDRRRHSAAALREADAAGIGGQSSVARGRADDRVGAGLQSVEYVGVAQALPVARGRARRQSRAGRVDGLNPERGFQEFAAARQAFGIDAMAEAGAQHAFDGDADRLQRGQRFGMG